MAARTLATDLGWVNGGAAIAGDFSASALLWTAPILAGLLLAIPFAVATTSPTLGRLLMAASLCAIPEELSPPPEVRAVCGWLSAVDSRSRPVGVWHRVVGRRGLVESRSTAVPPCCSRRGPVMRRWEDLATTDLARFDPRETVAVLPVAAVEQHGPHLPLGTDAFICDAILDEALAMLDPAAPVLRLPTQRLGHSPEHARFPGTLSLRAETMLALWTDIGRSVAAAGLRKLVLFNSHGGQGALIDLVAQALRGGASMTVARCSYYRFALPDGWIRERERRFGLHGGQVETSLMLHIAPHLVRLDCARATSPLAPKHGRRPTPACRSRARRA